MDMIRKIRDFRNVLKKKPPNDPTKVLFVCKISGLICCLAATTILGYLPSTFLHCCVMSYVLPGFVCGFIIINLIGAIINYSKVEMISDICFSVCSIFGNLYVSIDIIAEWVLWYSHDANSKSHISHFGTELLLLSGTCFINAIIMSLQLAYCCYTIRKQFSPPAIPTAQEAQQ